QHMVHVIRKDVFIPGTLSGTCLLELGEEGSANGQFSFPRDVVTDSNGNIYVAQENNPRVQKFNSSGTYLAQFANADQVKGLAIDDNDIIYATAQRFQNENNNQRILLYDTSGNLKGTFGSHGSGNGQFYNPVGIAVDKHGYVYVVDKDNHRVQKFR
ncbi:hypothetical protein M1N90_02555, partial [Dehalococcoidia bacterium]|nr:hypothetical protein [Dehalococcoidia bacterium]